MAPRQRKPISRGLPDNCYAYRPDGETVFYRYKHPKTGKMHGLGNDKGRAIHVARILNSRLLMPRDEADQQLVDQVADGRTRDRLAVFLEKFSDEILPGRRDTRGRSLAPATLSEYQRLTSRISDEWGHLAPKDVTRRMIAEFLDEWPPNTSNKYRAILKQIFRHAIAGGLVDDNPADLTIPKAEIVQRQRLTLEAFNEIRKASDPWFRNALDLALYTLQRREDLVGIRFPDPGVNELVVTQGKTGTTVVIAIGAELAAVIKTCRDDIASPLLIHKRSKRPGRQYTKKRLVHWSEIRPEMLTREFARVRDDRVTFKELPAAAKPSFHEIRALGADLYRKSGRPEADIQRLLGHTTAAMTAHYLDGHKDVIIHARADLKLEDIDI